MSAEIMDRFFCRGLKCLLPMLLVLCAHWSYGEVNYFNYHRGINKAEHLFFVENKQRQAFAIYDQLLQHYDFIFIKDYFIAAQIACKYQDTQRVYKYLAACFKNGLNIAELSLSPVLSSCNMQEGNEKLRSLYDSCRSVYLSRIDLDYLGKMYQQYSEDQNDKSLPRQQYNETLQAHLERLIGLIKTRGFPSDKLIGVEDSTVKVNGRNLRQWYLKVCRDNFVSPNSYLSFNNNGSLSSCVALWLLLHHSCAYQYLEPYIVTEIRKGNLHPRDAGLLYDNMRRMAHLADDPKLGCKPFDKHYYKLNSFCTYPDNWRNDIPRIDSLRQAWHIASIAEDSIRKSKIAAYHFYGQSGLWDCR